MDPDQSEDPPKKRVFGASTKEDQQKLISDAVPKSTHSATQYWVRLFTDYCKDQKASTTNFSSIPIPELSDLVGSFYVDAKTRHGTPFSKNSLLAARSAIQRHLSSMREINIFSDEAFARTNKLLDGVLKARKRAGNEPAVKHKEPLSEDDLGKLRTYFEDVVETTDAIKLAFYVWYQLTLHFCLRGGEMQSKLTKRDLVFESIDGQDVLRLGTSFMSKNHQGGLTGSDWSSAGVINDQTQLTAIKRYLDKLHPDQDRLFQRAVKPGKLPADMSCWYTRSPLSHNLLAGMMKRLSELADLSMAYTNHCVRATCITNMKRSGIDDRRICSVSGHRNVQSLSAYDRPTTKDSCSMAAAVDLGSVKAVPPATCKENFPLHPSSIATSVQASPVQNSTSTVSSSALAPYLNAAASTFQNTSIVFNIHADRAKQARKKLKRKRSTSDSTA